MSRFWDMGFTSIPCYPTSMRLAILFTASLLFVSHAQAPQQPQAQETQVRGYWVDPGTGLMWAGKDNGKDVSWKNAIKYCRDLRLAGYSDWRLASMFELQPIYDRTVNAPGLAGPGKGGPDTWHVKGNLFLTGYEWSKSYRLDDRGKFSGYVYYFDFNEGKSNDDPTGFPYPYVFRRALCVRGSG